MNFRYQKGFQQNTHIFTIQVINMRVFANEVSNNKAFQAISTITKSSPSNI